MTLVGIHSRFGHGRIWVLEEVLNQMVSEGRIDSWQVPDATRYEVLTDKDVSEIEGEILSVVRQKMASRRRA